MSNITISTAPQGDDLAALQQQLEAATAGARQAELAGRVGDQGHHITAGVQQVNALNGQMTLNSTAKVGKTATATPGETGFVTIGGLKTDIASAKAAGLLPQNYVEGVVSGPFAGAEVEDQQQQPKSQDHQPNEAEGVVAKASAILTGLDQMAGPAVTDALLNEAIDNGGYAPAHLPAGFTAEHVADVVAGYRAGADAMLGEVGSSVAAVEELLTPEEQRLARQATVGSDKVTLAELGRTAQARLARLPEQDPRAFNEALAGMDPAHRKMIAQDRNTKEWRVSIPGRPVVAFGAAVELGWVKF
ncbi:hypothetical protein [Paenirhodobacter populi]|uniref:Uncharacterized protein n=1 Tax=Paenirhodobacter populi TaxID=2306993 RepID=A0A443IJC1_9RHOB|nr:hypothetical protein [Sinirhodobacter populi]RWR04483.1 hypothetical protein D2T33_21010 [Sinirhodobacter populi]